MELEKTHLSALSILHVINHLCLSALGCIGVADNLEPVESVRHHAELARLHLFDAVEHNIDDTVHDASILILQTRIPRMELMPTAFE